MKKFVLGVGAQKAGTTWLYKYLSSHPQANFGFAKEYHIFDSITLPGCIGFRRKIKEEVINLLENEFLRNDLKDWIPNNSIRCLSFINDPTSYFDYFSNFLNNDLYLLAGDISPSYSGLEKNTLESIKHQFLDRGIDVCPVFLMRDPVTRLQSITRMSFRAEGKNPTREEELRKMREIHLCDFDLHRVNYKRTVKVLDEVFGSNIFYEFYESFFTFNSIENLCSFLEIDYVVPDLEYRTRTSSSKNTLTKDQIRHFARGYSEIYDYCSQRFGEDKVATYWNRDA